MVYFLIPLSCNYKYSFRRGVNKSAQNRNFRKSQKCVILHPTIHNKMLKIHCKRLLTYSFIIRFYIIMIWVKSLTSKNQHSKIWQFKKSGIKVISPSPFFYFQLMKDVKFYQGSYLAYH